MALKLNGNEVVEYDYDPAAATAMAISFFNAVQAQFDDAVKAGLGYEIRDHLLEDAYQCGHAFETWACKWPAFFDHINDSGHIYRYLILDGFGEAVLALRPRLLYNKLKDGKRLDDAACLEVAKRMMKFAGLPPLPPYPC